MSAESPRHARYGPPLVVPSQPPSERSIIDALSGFINDVTLTSSSNTDPKDVIQWARFETADINEPAPEGEGDNDVSPLLLILGYGSGVQVWLIPPNGEAQEVLSWRQGTVRVLRILPTPQHGDCFTSKRPLIALCDSASPGPTFCSLSFISIRGGEQVKSIKFKNPILDVLANKRSIVVSFSERFAVFDAATLEDRMTITTCYPCPCPLGGNTIVNPLALGDRWLAYADKKLNPSKRSSGGCEGDGVVSVTASVLHAAKSLSKGLRGLGESVAHSLAGTRSTSQSPSPPNADMPTPGIVTIVDMEGLEEEESQDGEPYDPLVAHFVAHSEALIALKFDNSGMLLITADRRGHDFHVFRINPHPCGSNLASVHHLYVLHRGDTTAKVQDIAISGDSRWAAISTLRGTTHVFAISPYGGNIGVRTHGQSRVVNRLSRFHRSAGLPIPAIDQAAAEAVSAGAWYPNPRVPPHPAPTLLAPLAQLRPSPLPTNTITRTSAGRQRLSSLSEDSNLVPLLVRATFTPVGPVANMTSGSHRSGPVTSVYLMSASGSLTHLLLHPKATKNIPKEKICDDSPIELELEPVAQWALHRSNSSSEVVAPLPPSNPLLPPISRPRCADICMSEEERWLSQVEIVTHAGPHRRLWMGPQFVFKTYNFTGSNSSLSEAETVEIDTSGLGVARSNPVNMPCVRPIVPVLIDSGSASSLEHSPSDSFRRKSLLADSGRAASVCDVQLKEDLAEAMKEDHGRCEEGRSWRGAGGGVSRCVDPLGTVVGADDSPPRPAPTDCDDFTLDNADEATFRPVVRAPAPLPPAHMLVKPLPLTTTIPVQTVAPLTTHSPNDPTPLETNVVIPVQLTQHLDTYYNKDLKRDECQSLDNERANERSLPNSNRLSDDIQPNRSRVKKSPTPKSINDDSDEVCFQNESVKNCSAEAADSKINKKVYTESKKSRKDTKKSVENLDSKKEKPCDEPKKVIDIKKDNNRELKKQVETKERSKDTECNVDKNELKEEGKQKSVESKESFEDVPLETNDSNVKCDYATASQSVLLHSKKQQLESMSSESYEEIKTEEQAWHMLLNEPRKSTVLNDSQTVGEKENDDSKAKSKRNKMKKAQETFHSKSDEDSFVEIHAIEEKQTLSGDLVSISTPLDDNYASSETNSYEKSKKLRSPKSVTPDKNIKSESSHKNNEEKTQLVESNDGKKRCNEEHQDLTATSETITFKPKAYSRKKSYNYSQSESVSEKSSLVVEPIKPKSKSMSPQLDICKTPDERTDVYVIDTSEMAFPEIQVTKGFKSQKRSPQPTVRQSLEKEVVADKPVKSWSTITAFNKIDDLISPFGAEDKSFNPKDGSKEQTTTKPDEDEESYSEVSLQEKLSEICKRTDIIVAQCDEPSELNFVDEHHVMLKDLPPLEPLDFGLDDFKLEVMRDSLLEVDDRKITSPICKINIDEILSSLKETTKVPESSSAFNLIDLERVAEKKVSGFSVIEHDKIMSQEVKAEDERNKRYEKEEVMEKSSDDDNTSPIVTTDSDKEDKKNNGASKLVLPSSKQSAKSKKSRRKKK